MDNLILLPIVARMHNLTALLTVKIETWSNDGTMTAQVRKGLAMVVYLLYLIDFFAGWVGCPTYFPFHLAK